jgi:VRR-NUC domain
MRIIKSEDEEQALLCDWMAMQGIRFYAVPNGGKRDIVEAVKFKRTGVSPGVPDICVPVPRGDYHGLYIELKRSVGGQVSEKQKDWIEFLMANGYYAKVAHGFNEARETIMVYFSMKKT